MGEAEGSARAALAGRLNVLREGSDRTYASLARRIGISGSTLHRYCTGRTVPAEFGPVDRLARLCGAPAGEREALHRLWILADGERLDRQGPREAETAGTGTAGTAETSAAGAEAVVRAFPIPPGDAAPGEERPRSAPSCASPVPNPAGSGPPPGPVAASRRGRRCGPARAGVAAAVLVLALVAAPGEMGATGPDRGPQVARRSGEHPVNTPAPSPSGSPASGKPQRVPGGKPQETPDGSPRPTASPEAGSRNEPLTEPSGSAPGPDAGRAPFTWTGDDHVWKNGCGHAYLVERVPTSVPPPPVEADAASWAGALGAVHAGETGVRITLQGRSERAVVLEALRIRVVERRPPAKGRVYRMSSGCGGALTPRMFDVDLDVPRPVARPVAGNDSGEPIEAVSFPYSVSVTDPEVLLISGRTAGCDCDWFAELTWSSGGRSGTVRVDDDGRPFRTSGLRGLPVLDYDTAGGRWLPVAEEAPESEEVSS